MTSLDGSVLIGLDAGGSYIKATAFDLQSGASTTATRPVGVSHPQPGHNERDADELWAAAARVLRSVLAATPGGASRVAAVGVTGHGNGAYLVARDGRPTRYAIQASDTRAASLVAGWNAAGVPDMLRPTVWNGLWPGQPGPLLAWLACTSRTRWPGRPHC
jgi:L-xylulokinase